MLPEELIKKVRRIEITTRKMVDDVMSGQYRSQFKGHGVQFSEHRVYSHGDDIRHIDWKVSARSREPLVKKYEEERQLTALLIVDISRSGEFGSTDRLKLEATAEIAGMLAYAATHTGDQVGVVMFAGEVEKLIPPKKGRLHVQRIIGELLSAKPKTSGTQLGQALEAAERVMKHSGIIFIISDFIDQDYQMQLKRVARKHDVVSVWISDIRESEWDSAGTFYVVDPETGVESVIDPSSYRFKKWFDEHHQEFENRTSSTFTSNKIDLLRVFTQEDYGEAVVRFFRSRSRRKR